MSLTQDITTWEQHEPVIRIVPAIDASTRPTGMSTPSSTTTREEARGRKVLPFTQEDRDLVKRLAQGNE